MEQLKAEPPECPVCLTPYDAVSAIPRVLPCGHSTCEACLAHLPNPFPNTIRCPSCTHLAKFPNCPSSFPKNFDLLHISSLLQPQQQQQQQHPIPKKVISPPTDHSHIDNQVSLLPNLFPHEFYVNWIKWVLPNDIVLAEPCPEKETNDEKIVKRTCRKGIIQCTKLRLCSGSRKGSEYKGNNNNNDNDNDNDDKNKNKDKSLFGCVLRDGEEVGLVKVGSFVKGKDGDELFKYNYEAKVIEVLHGMGENGRDEIGLLLNASLRLHRVGKVYGFWCDEEKGDSVYMVCERFSGGLVKRMEELEYGFIRKGEEEGVRLKRMASFGMVGMEMCEAVSGLHSEGLVVGCLSLSCFGFNDFGHVYVDFHEVIEMGREVRRLIADGVLGKGKIVDEDLKLRLKNGILENHVFISPEVLSDLLRKEGVELECASLRYEVGCRSDVWSLACLLVWLLTGKPFMEVICNYYLEFLFDGLTDEKSKDCLGHYTRWTEKIVAILERTLDSEFVSLKGILCKCFEFDPQNRPALTELWRCIRELVLKPDIDVIASVKPKVAQESKTNCVILGELCQLAKESDKRSIRQTADSFREKDENYKPDVDQEENSRVDRDVGEGVSGNHVKCIDLKGHLDCITGLAVGGGFLFSSSYDKIVNVWSLQDFSHVHSFKGHEHRVMAVVFVDEGEPLCVSGDNGGVICIWDARVPLGPEPIKKLFEQKDWRYSGIHALAVSGAEYLYTGSGDKTIKAWSLQDYTIACTMSGHKSVVSSLAVSNGVLYSGSWDGTVRLWSLSDHSPLAVLGEGTPGSVSSVASLAANCNVLVVAHEDGCLKIWHNDTLLKSEQAHDGAIFAVIKKGKWLFAGGWDKTITVQELSGDGAQLEVTPVGSIPSGSTITTLAYWQGKLFAGQADRVIKVYYSRF